MNNLEILDNIMQPYFDKKKEIAEVPLVLENEKKEVDSKIHELEKSRIEKRKSLELELESLRVRTNIYIKELEEKKEKEIESYLSETMDSSSNFYVGYGSFLRKDLEQQYNKELELVKEKFKNQEEQLVSEIDSLKNVSEDERNEKQNLEKLSNKLDYTRVYLREMVELKDDLRKKLFAERKKLNSKLPSALILPRNATRNI